MKKSEKLSYESAFSELNQILESLQKNEIGIDSLAEKIKRASELVEYCQQKLRDTEAEIGKVSQ